MIRPLTRTGYTVNNGRELAHGEFVPAMKFSFIKENLGRQWVTPKAHFCRICGGLLVRVM